MKPIALSGFASFLSFILQIKIFGDLFGILLFIILLILSFLISASNQCIISSQATEVKGKLASYEKWIEQFRKNPAYYSATVLISNLFINICIIVLWLYLSKYFFTISSLSDNIISFIRASSIVLFLIIFFQVIPRIIATKYARKFTLFVVPLMHFLSILFWPLVSLYIALLSFSKKIHKKKTELSIGNLTEVIEISKSAGKENKKILEGIASYGSTYVVEIMKPRVDVVAFDIYTPFDELLKKITSQNYSRIPIFQETFDHVKGVLFVKDLLPHFHKKTFNWQTLIRPAYFVPESKKINDLLTDFQTKKIHMAVVTDEYGGTSGIATLEDVLEEIVGEIVDELDGINEFYKLIDENNYIFEGKTSLNDFNKIMNLDDDFLFEIKGEADTLAGMVLEKYGEIPKIGTSFIFKNFTFSIISTDKRRIKQIKVSKNATSV